LGLGISIGAQGAFAQPADTTHISTQPLFTSRDLIVLGGFAAATALSFPIDKRAAKRLQDPTNQENRALNEAATTFRTIAYPGAYLIGASMYSVGRLGGNKRIADLGLHGTEALIIGQLTGTLIKNFAGRARPYVADSQPQGFHFARGWKGNDAYRSFPSGHTTAGFAAASAVTSETSRWWPKSTWIVGPIMYGGAAMIGVSRMYNNKHWASDVLVGAAIGTFAGQKVVRYHHSHPGNRVDKWMLQASLSPSDEGGVRVAWNATPGFLNRP
jgi:membrane-associated phospholipid phosphatase